MVIKSPVVNRVRERYLFQHAGTLVDAFDPATRLVFVFPAKNLRVVNFGEMEFEVVIAERMEALTVGAPDYDIDELIVWMLDRVCNR